jgi:hypothetical protein
MSVRKGCERGGGGGGGVVRCGYLKKMKTSRRKFFVLRAETAETSARLEYYDTERKFNSGLPPKRSIPLKNCFNINRRLDTKYKHVIALYTKDDCFCVVLDNEEDVDSWLKALLSLQHGEEVIDGEPPKPTFGECVSGSLANIPRRRLTLIIQTRRKKNRIPKVTTERAN